MSKRAIFLDRDGVLNIEKTFVLSPSEMELYPRVGQAVRKVNASPFLAIVVTNQSAVARNYITEQELGLIHQELRRQLAICGAHLDGLYYCPHREVMDEIPQNPEYIKDCSCRKPKPGLLMQAARDFDIDLASSYLIGDSVRDIEAGKRAGCTTIGLRTGHALQGLQEPPDHIFDTLEAAVNYILESEKQ